MNKLQSLSISIKNLKNDTAYIEQYFSSNLSKLIFHPVIIEADVDIKNYCGLLTSIKNYALLLDETPDNSLIKEHFQEVPDIYEDDFYFYTKFPLPTWVLFVLFPMAIFVWVVYYTRISNIQNKLSIVNAKLNTIDFFLDKMI